MIHLDSDPDSAEPSDQLSGLLDGLRAVVVRPDGAATGRAAASRADDRRTSLAQGGCDAAPSASSRPCNDRYPATKRISIQ